MPMSQLIKEHPPLSPSQGVSDHPVSPEDSWGVLGEERVTGILPGQGQQPGEAGPRETPSE